jgi:hypothetical protein
MDDEELQSALGGELPADTAAENHDATDPDGGLSALIAELDPALADETAPAEDEDDGPDADGADEDEETDLEAIKRERDELRQAKRDADTRAAQAENEALWGRKEQAVNDNLRQALDHLDTRMQQSMDPAAEVREYLPRLIAGFRAELTNLYGEREAAWQQIARHHGARTYRQEIQTQYRLSETAMDEIAAEFPPEQWHSAAKLHARTAAPYQNELTQTQGKLTKAERAVHAQRLNRQIAPGPGRAAPLSMADALDRITEEKAPEQLGAVLRLVGVA